MSIICSGVSPNFSLIKAGVYSTNSLTPFVVILTVISGVANCIKSLSPDKTTTSNPSLDAW